MTPTIITGNGKNHLLSVSKGILNVDGGTCVMIQEADHIHGWYIAEIIIRPRKKMIAITWGQVKLSAMELKPLPEYYNPKTGKPKPGVVEDRSEDGALLVSDEFSFQEVAPGVMWYSYDAFFDLNINEKAGEILCGISLDRLCDLHLKIGKPLKITQNGFQYIQPVRFTVSYLPRTKETDPYQVAVTVTAGVAPYEYSVDGIEYDTEVELTYAGSENKTVYVRDNAGTVSTLKLDPAGWPALIAQQ